MAFAAVVSLVQTLDLILQPERQFIPHHKKRFKALREKLMFLQGLLEMTPNEGEDLENLARRIRDASHFAEDRIEMYVYRFNSVSSYRIAGFILNSYPKIIAALQMIFPSSPVFESAMNCWSTLICNWPYGRLNNVIKEIDSLVAAGEEISWSCSVGEYNKKRGSLLAGPSKSSFIENSVILGIEGDLIRIKSRFTGSSTPLEVIPIVGMGGIGKTTLAQKVYIDPLTVRHFDARAWITVSQVYNSRDILIQLLDSLGNLSDKVHLEGNDGLADHLHKTLWRRRYLIIMDDLWSTEAWDDFRKYFPDNANGSRIIMTTRIERVAAYASNSIDSLHHMSLFREDASWELLCAKVFGEEGCPFQLADVAMGIAVACHGLPLAIVVMAGLLLKVQRTADEWNNVLKNLHSVQSTETDAFLGILLLSYNHLPQHLKACFLYMGLFPEDSRISFSKLIKLWAAEGFLKPNIQKNFEKVAEDYVLELAERSLVSLYGKRREKGQDRVELIGIHDLLRDLCIREAEKENFLQVANKYAHCCIKCNRRISISSEGGEHILFSACSYRPKRRYSSVRSLLYNSWKLIPSDTYSCFKLLRVLDITNLLLFNFPLEVLNLVNLRYLAFPYHGEIPESISNLWNLQTLIFYPLYKTFALCPRPLPLGIWSMPRLRHLKFHVLYLSEFPNFLSGWKKHAFLGNLQSISDVHASFCTDEVLQEVPNLKNLGIWMETWTDAPLYINNLICLQHLAVLKCSVRSFSRREVLSWPHHALQTTLAFPTGLKELTLRACRIPWRDMSIVGSLPNLERLKLRDYAFVGTDWEPNEGEFRQLSVLLLDGSDLVHWSAEQVHFPLLRHLIIENCWRLEEIPFDFGEIPTLESINLDNSSPSAVISATRILEEQHNIGNHSLEVNVYPAGMQQAASSL